jgi:hypothetical protein
MVVTTIIFSAAQQSAASPGESVCSCEDREGQHKDEEGTASEHLKACWNSSTGSLSPFYNMGPARSWHNGILLACQAPKTHHFQDHNQVLGIPSIRACWLRRLLPCAHPILITWASTKFPHATSNGNETEGKDYL